LTDHLDLKQVLRRIGQLEIDAKAALATHEGSSSRVVSLEATRDAIGDLSLDQDELFREALHAIEAGLYRAAHVLAWAGFIDFMHEYLAAHYLLALQAARPTWNISASEDLRDWGEFAVIEAGKAVGAYNKTTMKALHGLLNRRNECAHPSDYFPDLNEALGYISELFKRLKTLMKATSP